MRNDVDYGQPIDEALAALTLSESDRATVLALPGIWTLGDLLTVLERGEVDPKLAAKLKKAIT